MDKEKMIEIMRDSSCNDPFNCPFCLYGKNSEGHWGCFARFPNGSPYDEDHGCFIQQIADVMQNMVDVVRCKDCKHAIAQNNKYVWCKFVDDGLSHDPDWYCADGEIKNESNNKT